MRLPALFLLACTLVACADEEPTATAVEFRPESEYARDGRPATPRARTAWLASAFAPYNGIDVLNDQPFRGAILDVMDDGFAVGVAFFPEPSAFFAPCACLGYVYFAFDGAATRYNYLAIGGSEIKPWWPTPLGPTGSGRPVIFDPFTERLLDLPLPPGSPSAVVTGLGPFRRPFVVGTAYYPGGMTRAVSWAFNQTTRVYELAMLPDGPAGTSSAVLNLHAGANLIVGSVDGHPATWPFDNPATFTSYPLITGEFRDANVHGDLIGKESGGPGFLIPNGGPVVPIAMDPAAINDGGYIVGAGPAGAVLRLKTGVLRDLPMPEAGDNFGGATAITKNGLIVGAAGVSPSSRPTTWGFFPSPDGDHDLVPNDMDNCPLVANGQQEDADENFVGDICEPGSPPSPAIIANATQRFEGGYFIFDAGTSTDPLSRPLTYTWSFSDGGSASGVRVRKKFADEGTGTYSVTLTADNTVESADASIDVTVRNARPNLIVTLPSLTPTVGVPFEIDLDMDDPGVNDTFTWYVDWGDGVIDSGPCATNPCSVTASHTYAVTGEMSFRSRVTDGVIYRHHPEQLMVQ